jgi:hypothetical protein
MKQTSGDKAPLLSYDMLYYYLGNLYADHKKYGMAYENYKKSLDACYSYRSQKKYFTSTYLYCLLHTQYDYDFASLQSARRYLDDNKANTGFSYSLFLNRQINAAIEVYQQALDKNEKVDDDSSKTVIVTRMTAMQFIQKNPAGAMKLVNYWFDENIKDETKVKEIIAGMLAEQIDLAVEKYGDFISTSRCFDLDLLCLLQPENKEAQLKRNEAGVALKNRIKQLPVEKIWEEVTVSENKYSLQDYLSRAAVDWSFEKAVQRSGKSNLPCNPKNYSSVLDDIRYYFATYIKTTVWAVEVKEGYFIIYYTPYKPLYIKVDDIKRITASDDRNSIHMTGEFYNSHTDYRENDFFLFQDDKKGDMNKLRELFENLFKQMRKK